MDTKTKVINTLEICEKCQKSCERKVLLRSFFGLSRNQKDDSCKYHIYFREKTVEIIADVIFCFFSFFMFSASLNLKLKSDDYVKKVTQMYVPAQGTAKEKVSRLGRKWNRESKLASIIEKQTPDKYLTLHVCSQVLYNTFF